MQSPVATTGDYVAAFMSAFKAPRGEKMVHAGGRGMRIRTPGERVIYLPNGHAVKVTVDDSGVATQIEEDEALHAIVRPEPIRYQFKLSPTRTVVDAAARPRRIRTRTVVPLGGSRVPRR
jgi:hypothetical protein